jgi:pilus assembly protein FimV
MALRTRLSALLLVLACGQGVFAQNPAATPTALTVGAGDTATALAQKLRPEGATLEQTLVALWRTNPRAFGNGNLNQLLQGATLQVPSEREILRLSAAQAHALVVEQVENFQAFARQQNPNRPAASAPATGPDAAQWARALAEAQALKDALERQSRDTQTRLAQLEKNIQTLQSMQAVPSAPAPAPAASAASEASSEPLTSPAAEASTPQPQASSPASEAAAVAASAPASAPALTLALPQPLLWTGALLALMMVLALVIRRRSRTTAPAARPGGLQEIPPQMASIDLNLDSPPTGPVGPQDKRP